MTLLDNPIVRTHLREQWRGLAKPGLIAALFAMLGSIGMFLLEVHHRRAWSSTGEARWRAANEVLSNVSVLHMGFAVAIPVLAVAWSIHQDRRSRVLEANFLTPLASRELLVGYWLGPALLPFAASLFIAVAGIVIALLGNPTNALMPWLQSVAVATSTGLFASLLAASICLTSRRTGALVLWAGLIGLVLMFSGNGMVYSAPHLLAGTHFATEIGPVLRGYESLHGLESEFVGALPLFACTLLAQAAGIALTWGSAVPGIEAHRGAAVTSPLRRVAPWIVAFAGVAALQFALLASAMGAHAFAEAPGWNPAPWRISSAFVGFWGAITLWGLLVGMRQLPSAAQRHREAVRLQLRGVAPRRVSAYALVAALALALGVAAAVFVPRELTPVSPSLEITTESCLTGAGLLALSWTLALLFVEICTVRFGRRGIAWAILGGTGVGAVLLLCAHLFLDPAPALVFPGLLPGFVAYEGLKIESPLAEVVVAQLALLAALVWVRQRVLRSAQASPSS